MSIGSVNKLIGARSLFQNADRCPAPRSGACCRRAHRDALGRPIPLCRPLKQDVVSCRVAKHNEMPTTWDFSNVDRWLPR